MEYQINMTPSGNDARVLKGIHHDYASALALKLGLRVKFPSEIHLPSALGFGFESNNQEALESWVYMVCSSLKLPFTTDSIPTLESILIATLEALEKESGHVL